MLTITDYLKANTTYTRTMGPLKGTPYTQFILGLKDGAKIAVDRETYRKVKEHIEDTN